MLPIIKVILFAFQPRNVLFMASFEIAPIVAQVCAAHILLNIHDVTGLSSNDSTQQSVDDLPTTVPWDRNRHALSFQMGPLQSRKPRDNHDVLDFDMDGADTQPVIEFAPPSMRKIHLSWDGTDEPSSTDLKHTP